MKVFTFLLFLLFTYSNAQQPGDLVSSELKLDLSPTGIVSWVDENCQDELYQWVYDYLDQFPYGMQAYKITYKSLDYDDNLVNATGLIMFPKTNNKMSNVLFMSPTTDNRENVPSNLKGTYQLGIVIPMLLVVSEYIVIAPDYLGMGDGDGELAYIEDKTAAAAGLDMLKAANQFLDQLGKQRYDEYFVGGYSQGGHAAMAVTNYNQNLRAPYNIEYVASGAGPYDMSDSMLNHGILDNEEYPNSAFIAYVMQTCHNIGYTQFSRDWNEVISDEYIDQFRASALNGEGGLDWGPEIWRDLFQDDFITNLTNDPYHPARECARSNDVYDFYNKTPTMMFSSIFDNTVISRNDEVALRAQRGYYPWWDLSKYKIQKNTLGPWDHTIGAFPYILAAIYKFNENRAGGFFNTFAQNTGEYSEYYNRSSQYTNTIEFIPSSFAPEITGQSSLKQRKLEDSSVASLDKLSRVQDEISLIEVTITDGTKRNFPYMQTHAIELKASDVLEIYNSDLSINMKNWSGEIKFINFINTEKIVRHDENPKHNNVFNYNLKDLPTFDWIEIVTDAAIFKVKMPEQIEADNTYSQVIQDANTTQLISTKAIQKIEVYSTHGHLIQSFEGNNKSQVSFQLNKGMYIIQTTYVDGTMESIKYIHK